MIIEALTVGNMAVCCYVVGCEQTKQAMIIDPGGDEDRVLKLCEDKGLAVKYIINTHGHPDHVCGNSVIKSKTGAEIVIHEEDAKFFAKSEVEQYFSILGLPPSPPPDKLVKEGDEITVGSVSLKVIHTPGHTPGGMCLYSAPNLFSGDTLFVGGVGRTDFPGGESTVLFESIREKLLSLPAETIVWPGHGYGGATSTIGEEKKSNPFLTGV